MNAETETYICADHGAYARAIEHRWQDTCPTCSAQSRNTVAAWRESHARYARWVHSGIPFRYRNRSLVNYRPSTPNGTAAKGLVTQYVDRFQDHFDEGRGFALIGPVGTGKTHLAVGALTGVIAAGWKGRLVSVPALFAELKAGFGSKGREGDELLENLRSTQLLILDDLGAQRGTEWEADTLHGLLDYRYNEALPTCITTNVFDLARYAGERIADRCRETMIFIELTGESYRGRAGDDEDLKASPPAMQAPPKELTVRVCTNGQMRNETLTEERGL